MLDGKKVDSLFTVDIQKWGSGTNDCMWRVAQTAAGENASAAEVNQKLLEIAELNNEKDGYHIKDLSIVQDGQQILVPLDAAIENAKYEAEQKSQKYSEMTQTINTKTSEFEGQRGVVTGALTELKNAQSALSAIPDGEENDSARKTAQEALNNAAKAYEEAVAKQDQMAEELDKLKDSHDTLGTEIEAIKTELNEYTDEYNQEEQKVDKELEELAKLLGETDSDLKDAQGELVKLQETIADKEKGASDAKSAASLQLAQYKGGDKTASQNVLESITKDADGNVVITDGVLDAALGLAEQMGVKIPDGSGDDSGSKGEPKVSDAAAKKIQEAAGEGINLDDAVVETSGKFTTYKVKNADGKEITLQLKENDDGSLVETKRIVQSDDKSYTAYEGFNGDSGSSTHVKKYALVEGKQQDISYEEYNQQYTKPEDLKAENLTKRDEYSYDADGNRITASISYENGKEKDVRIERAGKETLVVPYSEYKEKGIEGIDAKNAQDKERTEFFEQISAEGSAYPSSYSNALVSEYKEIQGRLAATATPSEADTKRAEEIYTALGEYKARIDNLDKLSDTQNADDKELAGLMQSYCVDSETYKSCLDSKNSGPQDVNKAIDAALQILQAKAELKREIDKLGVYEGKNKYTNELLNGAYSLEQCKTTLDYGHSVDISVLAGGNFVNDNGLDGYVSDALKEIQTATDSVKQMNTNKNTVQLASSTKQTQYSSNDVLTLMKAYETFMDSAYENTRTGILWWNHIPDEVENTKNNAEKILFYALSGGEAPEGLDIQTAINELNSIISKNQK